MTWRNPWQNQIAFVFVANVIRSPLAKYLFDHITIQKGVAEKYKWHYRDNGLACGGSLDLRMRLIAARHGLNITHWSRQFTRGDFNKLDLIAFMEPKNRDELIHLQQDP